MSAASILIKPSSANCNIDCKYCFYKCLSSNREEYSKGFMTDETLDTLVKNAFDYVSPAKNEDGKGVAEQSFVSFAFQGGEPTLAGLDFFRRVVELQKKYNDGTIQVENTLQTNGMIIDDEWAKFFAENHFLIGVSLDGPKKMHDAYRVDTVGKPTFERIMNTLELFDRYQVDYNILTVVTEQTAQKASSLYKFYKRNGFQFVQLIPCMDEPERFKDTGIGSPFAVKPESYGKFLCEFFDLWYQDFMQGENMEVRMFSNLAQMAAGYPAEECGMQGHCSCYFVVEGDGSVYPCDFYCIDSWKLGTVENSFKEMISSEKVNKFLQKSYSQHEKCAECSYLSLCHGGCRRWRESVADGELGLNYLCSGYEMFFEHTWERLINLGKLIVNKYGKKSS